MKLKTPLKEEIKTGTGWIHWPIFEPFFELKRKVALGDLSLFGRFGLVLFVIVLGGSCAAIVSFDIKRLSDFGGIFVLYLATLMLALQPEGTPEDTADTLRVKQKRHVRIALGFVVFGTMMQIASFNLDGRHSTKEDELKATRARELANVDKKVSLAVTKLKELETKSVVLAQNLDQAKSELASVKGIVESRSIRKNSGPGNVSHAVRR